MNPIILDLYCGAGGASKGYFKAGFEPIGVDHGPQPRYPFLFLRWDAVAFARTQWQFIERCAAIHASPPCQRYTQSALYRRNMGCEYPDLVGPTRDALELTGKPWVMENVVGAPMRPDLKLCGCFFNLPIRRVRIFETSWGAKWTAPEHKHAGPVLSVVGCGTPTWVRQKLGYSPVAQDYRDAMGIQWMTRKELSQAIPPAYTELVGRMLKEQIQ